MQPQAGAAAPGPLRGLRILDLSEGIAGPYATKLLADYGADVVKLERPDGDPCRRWHPICTAGGSGPHSAFFAYLNTNKRSLSLNLKAPAGRDLFLRLAPRFDAVVESFRPGVLDRLGAGYGDQLVRRADAILVSVTSFGQQGTFRDYLATELTVFALGGKMSQAGTRPRPPVRLLAGSSLYMAGTVAASAIVTAIRGRRLDGVGDHVDVSIANVILGQPDRGLCLYSYSHTDIERPDGPRPFQTFPAADGFVVINVNRGIERVAQMIGHPEIAKDPRFANNVARQENAAALEEFIIGWTAIRTKAEIADASARYRVISAPVSTVPEVLASEHLAVRNYFRSLGAGACRCQQTVPGPPFRIHTVPGGGWAIRRLPPAHGADAADILAEVGLSREEVDALRSAGVVCGTPLPAEVGQ